MTEQMTTKDKLLSTIEGLDPANNLWGTVGRTFNKMGIGEDEIAKATRRHPEHDVALWNAFVLLMPWGPMNEAPEPVYRAHCVELLDRVAGGLDTTLGTKAEIVMALSETSLATPLKHAAAVLYARLFQEILPHTPVAAEIDHLSTMAYDGETERILTDMAQNTRVPDRKQEESEWRTPPEQ